jgi:cysteine desulfurase
MVAAAKRALADQMDKLGNPSSLHMYGRATRKDVEESREAIARAVACRPSEVIFTGSGTEANNTALKGLHWLRANEKRNLVVISEIAKTKRVESVTDDQLLAAYEKVSQ